MNLSVVLQKRTQLTFILLMGLKELLQRRVAGGKTSGFDLFSPVRITDLMSKLFLIENENHDKAEVQKIFTHPSCSRLVCRILSDSAG